MDHRTLPLAEWNESHVRCWLESIGIKKEYVDKLYEEEVTGPVLKELEEGFLKSIGMKGGQIHILTRKRNELLEHLHKNTGLDLAPANDSSKKASEALVCESTNNAGKKKGKSRNSAPHTTSSILTREGVGDLGTISVTKLEDASNSQVTHPSGASEIDASSPAGCISKKDIGKTEATLDRTGGRKSRSLHENTAEAITLSKFRPFRSEDINFKYVKNNVLGPETGITDLVTPCHEYKSLAIAAELDRQRLQAKLAYEIIRFASACMNVRTNGTIHFGVMDRDEDKGWKHGQIAGVKVRDRDAYVDALDYIERCFDQAEREAARHCIHPPIFVEVIQKDSQEQTFVVEVDIEPSSSIANGRVFQVRLPRFNQDSNKVIIEKHPVFYQRVGANSEPVKTEELVPFIKGLQEKDARREKAESSSREDHYGISQDLGRKLSILLTDGKNYINDSLWYILVTNRCKKEDLKHINFLMRMNIFCVFDFDEDSNVSGLYAQFKEYHATSSHFLHDYCNENKMTTTQFQKHLCLFDHTSWIFCNGRSDYHGSEKPCDENTWIRTKKKYLKKAISFICDEILPKGSFVVLFLLLSPVEKPIVDTFQEFYTEMNGMEYIMCIAESREDYEKWANLAQASCNIETLEQKSIVGMKLSHVDATIQTMMSSTTCARHLPVSTRGLCVLPTLEEEKMFSLEILCVNQCDDIKLDLLTASEIQEIEQTFYQGRRICWKNFWLAEKGKCGEVIEREACKDVSKILDEMLLGTRIRYSVTKVKIFHHPGSGGSTIARQVLWKRKKELRCAIVKSSYPVATVCQHAVNFRKYEEKDTNHCPPVLLLIEDYDEDFVDELKNDLLDAMAVSKVHSSRTCFILMCCKRSNDPEKRCKDSPLDTVAVTHKLTDHEKSLFKTKLERFTKQKDFKPEFILTFVLMCEEFKETYVREFVQHLLQGIDLSSRDTSLMRYVALLNFYVHNSYVSLSHCEAFLGLGAYTEKRAREHDFRSHLSEQARVIFIELREDITYLSSVQIIHYLVAKEILQQLSGDLPQSQIAMSLLQEKVLFQHRFGREEFIKFIRDLFIRRDKKSRGDNTDSLFSPFIEHVCSFEDCEKAIAVLKAAYECLGKDAFFAQQLARLHYNHDKFEDAEYWAGVAKSHLPNDSFILDTEGQVYRRWFSFTVDKMTEEATPEEAIQKIEIALKAMKCFRAAQQAAKLEIDTMNNAGYFGEVEVGCRLLKFLSTLEVFPRNTEREHSELVRYLISDYIPESIKKSWGKLHSRLKGLRQNIYNALEWISEDLSYFQTDKNQEKDDEAEVGQEREEQVYNPRKWLKRQSEAYAKFFISKSLVEENNTGPETQLLRRMNIYRNGGGNVTTILSLLSDTKEKRSVQKLETIINFYAEDPLRERLEDIDLINYILSHITLACVSPGSSKLLPIQKLRELSKRFFKQRRTTFPASAYFLLTLLYWPDEALDIEPNPDKDDILISALQTMKHLNDIKMKNVAPRKKRIYTHFFLGKGYGLGKIVHKTRIDKLISGSLDERRMKWLHGDVWNIGKIREVLKRVSGWTEDRKVFIRGHGRPIHILPLHYDSVPPGSENVTLYLGFSFNGLVAYNIEVEKDKTHMRK
ncbi:PREDICTED: sterile alpha motif domain-containing protein 9-like isoform X1 [Gavialis gangeticus]|uniref:sterile alpha motif domain-containing protein 9-like isoform X1 n=1 Tax=Gavialis gangeticus TaxID=94835 RepID=UPI00092ECEC6|nr:PREDICTED: sterile alpha motif domain-containing protein 9-like isoform X1 [Gavialis gangeticus]